MESIENDPTLKNIASHIQQIERQKADAQRAFTDHQKEEVRLTQKLHHDEDMLRSKLEQQIEQDRQKLTQNMERKRRAAQDAIDTAEKTIQRLRDDESRRRQELTREAQMKQR